MSYALFVLNAHSQLQDATKSDLIGNASVIVCDAAMDTAVIRQHTNARLLSYWSAKALFMGAPESEFWGATRTTLLARTRPNRTPALIYDAAVYGGAPVDPGDSTPHVLIEPTLENAEALASVIQERKTLGGFGGVYIDDCWNRKPPRLTKSEQDGIRWSCYLHALFAKIPGAWANCGGLPATGVTRICCEAPSVDPLQMVKASLDLGAGRQHIYWYGPGVEGLFLEGRLL